MTSSMRSDQEVITINPVRGLTGTLTGATTRSSATSKPSSAETGEFGSDLNQRKTALLVIDLQEDFCPPNGSLAVSGGRDIAPAINELLQRPFDLKIATRDWHPADHVSFAHNHDKKPFDGHTIHNPGNPQETHTTVLWPGHCVQGTTGANLIPELNEDLLNYVLNKGMDSRVESYSAFGPPFRNPSLGSSWLRQTLNQAGVRCVFVTGLAFDYCVKFTALDAAELGFETFVLMDCTNAVNSSPEGYAAASSIFHAAGIHLITRDQLSISTEDGVTRVEDSTGCARTRSNFTAESGH